MKHEKVGTVRDYKKCIDGVYYDTKHDHLVCLQWIGNRFYLYADFDDCHMKAVSKRNPSLEMAGLVYVGEYYDRKREKK